MLAGVSPTKASRKALTRASATSPWELDAVNVTITLFSSARTPLLSNSIVSVIVVTVPVGLVTLSSTVTVSPSATPPAAPPWTGT